MSLNVLGRHFFLGLRPTIELHADDRKLLATVKPAGVIVFRGNFAAGVPYAEWHARFVQLIADVRDAIGRDDVLIAIDHEGGTVLRTPPPFTPFGFARAWADRAAGVGRAMGVELASLGINVNFAPVVDIDSNPNNPVIGPRAFGTTADEVIGPARAFIDAMQAEGVLACPKHYPGHGDTAVDSHVGLPVLDLDRDALAARELRPFAALVPRDVHLIMTAHISFPRIDPDGPATMSAALVDGVLRGELGYRGAIVTDDLGMRAVSALFDAPGACARALHAGADLLMLCSHWSSTDRAYAMLDDLARSSDRGELSARVLETSGARIAALLARLTPSAPRLLTPDELAAHAAVAPLRQRAGAVGQTVSLDEA